MTVKSQETRATFALAATPQLEDFLTRGEEFYVLRGGEAAAFILYCLEKPPVQQPQVWIECYNGDFMPPNSYRSHSFAQLMMNDGGKASRAVVLLLSQQETETLVQLDANAPMR